MDIIRGNYKTNQKEEGKWEEPIKDGEINSERNAWNRNAFTEERGGNDGSTGGMNRKINEKEQREFRSFQFVHHIPQADLELRSLSCHQDTQFLILWIFVFFV